MRLFNLEDFRREDKTEMWQVTIFGGILGWDRLEEAMKLKDTYSFVHFIPGVREQYPDNI